MKKVFLICFVFTAVFILHGGENSSAAQDAAAIRALEALAAENADAAALEAWLLTEFEDTSTPMLQCALGMTALQQALDNSGEKRHGFLLLAAERLGNASGNVEKSIDNIVKLELARAIFLLADSVPETSESSAEKTAELCRMSYAALQGMGDVDHETSLARDTLLFWLCAKTGFTPGMTEYRKRIAAAGGNTDDLPQPVEKPQMLDGRDWLLQENYDRSYTLTNTAGTFVAGLYRLPAEQYGRRELFPEYLHGFAAPVLKRSKEGKLDIHSFESSKNSVTGVYSILTDKEWQPGDNKKGSHQYVVIAFFSSADGKDPLYLVLFCDFYFSRQLEEILAYSAELAAGN